MQKNPTLSFKATEVRGRAAVERREFSPRQARRPIMAELYRKAEAQLRKQSKVQEPTPQPGNSKADPRRLLHELQVHQIELDMQNYDLRLARDELEKALENYTDLYDFAPVGYFTLTADSSIQQANLTGASLVGIERSRLVGRCFDHLFAAEQRPAFHAFLKQVFAGQTRQSGEFEISRPGQPPRTVNIEAQCSPHASECRAALVDITERKLAEDKTRVSEIRYRRLFEAAHDGVLLIDPGTRKITDANPFMTRLLGYPHEQLVGKELFEIGLLKDEEASQEMFRNLQRTHEVRYEDLPLESKQGRHQEVEVVASLYQENGRSVIQCSIRDITARKRAEIASNRLAAIVAFSEDAIISQDPTGIITSWNKGAEKIFGYAAHETVGTSILRLIPADRRDEEHYILGKIKRGDSVRQFETLRQTKNGRLINVSITASPIKDATGKILGVSKVARDITERKLAEEMLRRNEALFSALVEQAPFGVYVVDARFRMQQVNRKAKPVFKKVHHLLGRGFSEIIHLLWPKKVADQIEKRFRHTLKTGEPYQSPEFTARRRDLGVKEIYEWQIQRVTLPAGEHGVVCFFNNITERKRAEETQHRVEVLAASNRKLHEEIMRRHAVEESLRKSEQHQTQLLEQSRLLQEQLRQLSRQILTAQEEERREISRELHDVIAQTLTGINVRLAGLKQDATRNTKSLDRNIARTQRQVERSVDLVHQFARELRPTVLDDLGLIPALHAFMKSLTTRTGIRTRLTAFAAVKQLDGDRCMVLYRVAQEALTNVARHAKASRVEVNIQKLPGGICMKIKDDGQSFDAERVLQTTGKGRLGLLGMRERVEMVGGCFDVESAPGKGTTIVAHLPPGKVARGGQAEFAEAKT